jgi:hypothetical protein
MYDRETREIFRGEQMELNVRRSEGDQVRSERPTFQTIAESINAIEKLRPGTAF